MGNRGRRFTLGMTAATKHERHLSCLPSHRHIALFFLAKKVNFGIYKFVCLQYDFINFIRKCFCDCTGVFYRPDVRKGLTGVKNPPIRAVRTDRTYGQDVRAQKMTPVRTVDFTARTYG